MDEIEDLYRRHAPEVFRFALRLSGERAEAEDITAEVFVRVWAAPGPIRVATVRAYLFAIARNLYLQNLRRQRRHVDLDEQRGETADPAPDPLAQAEQAAEVAAVLAAVRRLPEEQRTPLLMRVLHELPYQEIADALGISLAAAKLRIHRARRALLGSRNE